MAGEQALRQMSARARGAGSRRTAPEEKGSMSDERTTIVETTPSYSGALLGAIAVAVLAALGGLVWSYALSNRITRQEAALSEANQQNAKLDAQLRETNARLRVATDELGKSVGMTQKQLDARAQQIIAHEAAENRKLETAQQQTAQQVTAVQSDVSNVKTDVGGVKTDLTKTQGDLATAVSQLTSMKGDLSNHASLIARNGSELEVLKHKGDRNYYEFTLTKGQKKPVGTVSMELKKTDAKKSRFTLVVYADDRSYEKKDRNVDEPLQFYSGKDPALYEIVVNTIGSKNTVSGYLSTPKGAPAPPNVQ
jgi:F0F1-type ATP synthase membrane subunit b/b'